MISKTCSIRVRYADTDQMGVVYYSRYLEWFEVGRTEYLRALGWPYRRMEEEGVFLPVVEAHVQYHRSTHYDDLVQVRTRIGEMSGVRLKIECEVWREGELLASGYTVHAFLNGDGKPIRPSKVFVEALKQNEQ
ncbi:MAG: acyl-CoA thioesterase [Candidatus Latescibacteria bacterium]|nr:acyl-CoA thioesterase [Candidatus Latescibacterota bacterium]OPX25546.1 MAG: hypothetical protein B1H02_01180 [Candidatus Latescibacteria bacterium 4484_107]